MDEPFWRSERQRIKTAEMSSAEEYGMVEGDLKSEDVENSFESALQAWQGRLPAAVSGSSVMCPSCAAECQHVRRRDLGYKEIVARFKATNSAGTDPMSPPPTLPVSPSASGEAGGGEGN
jgi:hypothetical protein